MILEVAAASADHDAEIKCYMVVMAENPDGSGWHVIFADADSYDAQDVRLGQNTYSVATSDGATYYGGIGALHREGNEVEVTFNHEAQNELRFDESMLFRLQNENAATTIQAGLRRVTGR